MKRPCIAVLILALVLMVLVIQSRLQWTQLQSSIPDTDPSTVAAGTMTSAQACHACSGCLQRIQKHLNDGAKLTMLEAYKIVASEAHHGTTCVVCEQCVPEAEDTPAEPQPAAALTAPVPTAAPIGGETGRGKRKAHDATNTDPSTQLRLVRNVSTSVPTFDLQGSPNLLWPGSSEPRLHLPVCTHFSDIQEGKWSAEPFWEPSSCRLRKFSPAATHKCLHNRKFGFFGDSLLLGVYTRELLQFSLQLAADNLE